MKLENLLKIIYTKNDEGENVLNKRACLIALGAALILIVLGVVIVAACNSRNQEMDTAAAMGGAFSEAKHQEVASEILRQEELKFAKEEYLTLLSAHNEAVSKYNEMAKKHNDLLEKFIQYNVLGLPEAVTWKEAMTGNFAEYYENGADAEGIRTLSGAISEETEAVNLQYEEVCLLAINSVISDYNVMSEAYNEAIKVTSIDFIEGMATNVKQKEYADSVELQLDGAEEALVSQMDALVDETSELVADYIVVTQITNPTEEWVYERLGDVKAITGKEAVTQNKDPNELLGKEGGYTSCIYFTVQNIDEKLVKGSSIVEKGTDAGGCIEVYPTLEYALNRCDYLSQFDNTLLYSGSYAIVGTMVVRTSYQLSNQEQVELTDEIVRVLTEVW